MSNINVGILREKISQKAGAAALRVVAYNGNHVSLTRLLDEMKHFGFEIKPQEDDDALPLLTIEGLVFSISIRKSVETQQHSYRLTLVSDDTVDPEAFAVAVRKALSAIENGIDAYRRSHHASGDNKAE